MELDTLQEDTLKELFNMSLGRAVASLSEMMGSEVVVSLPELTVIPRRELPGVVTAHLATPVGMVGMPYRLVFAGEGEVAGVALLLVPREAVRPWLELLWGQQQLGPESAGSDAARETLREVGDLLLYTCASSMSQFLDSEIEGGTAGQVEEDAQALLRLFPAPRGREEPPVAELQVRFHLPGREEVAGMLVFLIDLDALPLLQKELNRLVCGLAP